MARVSDRKGSAYGLIELDPQTKEARGWRRALRISSRSNELMKAKREDLRSIEHFDARGARQAPASKLGTYLIFQRVTPRLEMTGRNERRATHPDARFRELRDTL